MGLRIEIDVTDPVAADVIRFIASHTRGARVINESPTLDEDDIMQNSADRPPSVFQEEWVRQTLGLRPLVEIIRTPPPGILDRTNTAIQALVGDVFSGYDERFRIVDRDPTKARSLLVGILDRSLSEEAPYEYDLQERKGIKFFTANDDNKLAPHHISAVIKRYGLAIGERMRIKDIAVEEGLAYSNIYARVNFAVLKLSLPQLLRAALVTDIPIN